MKTCSLTRYELKYHIPLELIDEMAPFIRIYCKMDKHSRKSPDHFYSINSLYFDSPRLQFLKNRLNEEPNRFNMRVRSYGEEPQYPFFLEIKQRKIDVIRKFRAVVKDDNWITMLDQAGSDYVPLNEKNENGDNLRLFYRLALSNRASPKVLIQYRRLAFESLVDDYARITFDTDLCYQEHDTYTPVPQKENLTHFDNEAIFNPGCNVILEIKCYTSQIPLWVIDFIRTFNLYRGNFSKYCNGIMEVLQRRPCYL